MAMTTRYRRHHLDLLLLLLLVRIFISFVPLLRMSTKVKLIDPSTYLGVLGYLGLAGYVQ
jgi:hypothetical protein